MTRQPSLAMRAFLFASIPMVLTLILSFVAVRKAVEDRIKDQLRTSLHETEAAASRRTAESAGQIYRAISTLTENASLKAGVALLQENRDAQFQSEAHETLARQLGQIGTSLGFDLMLFENPSDQVLIGTVGPQQSRLELRNEPVEFVAPSLVRAKGKLYDVVSVPINLGSENLGTLIAGKTFDIRGWNEFGNTALIRDGQILMTTFPQDHVTEAEQQVQENCRATVGECEVQVGGETYLAMSVRQMFGDGVRLVSFQSIDAATKRFTQGFAGVFPLIGGAGVLLVLLFSAFGAHSIAKPLVTLTTQLRREGSAGGFSAELHPDYQTAEVNELAMEFSRAAGAVRESERRLDEATEEFIESMAQAQDARDPYTAGHSERVSANSTAIAKVMGVSAGEVEIIRIGAKLHDLGKIGIPDAILRKPGKLTREEYTLIQRHSTIGREILEKVGRFKEFIPIVELHHENPDGSGYPYGLREGDIPLAVRIVHVADVYDAITSDRAYRKAMSEAQAWELLRQGTGPLFDAEVVEALWTVLRRVGWETEVSSATVPHENDLAYYPLSLNR
jgi:putative nucleotidyltransferase with HDIG domain